MGKGMKKNANLHLPLHLIRSVPRPSYAATLSPFCVCPRLPQSLLSFILPLFLCRGADTGHGLPAGSSWGCGDVAEDQPFLMRYPRSGFERSPPPLPSAAPAQKRCAGRSSSKEGMERIRNRNRRDGAERDGFKEF